MKIHFFLRYASPVILAVGLFISLPANAQTMYTVNLKTDVLNTNATSTPFALDAQFTDGSGTNDGNNNATLSGFQFGTGGSATGSPTRTGGASGDLASTVTLTDNAFFTDFTQNFTPGNSPGSQLTFTLSLTNNVDAGGTPDEFSLSVLDKNGNSLPTSDPGSALLVINFNGVNPQVQTFSGTGNYAGLTLTATPIAPQVTPEPGALCLLTGLSLPGAGWLLCRRRKQTTR